MATPNIYGGTDIYAPVEQAQKYREQQNALARQQSVRNALGNAINPSTGKTNWEFAMQVGGPEVAPELQAMQEADILAQAKLDSEKATAAKAMSEVDKQWMEQTHGQLATLVGRPDAEAAPIWTAIRQDVAATRPHLTRFMDETYSPKALERSLQTAERIYPKLEFQNAGDRIIALNPYTNTQVGPAYRVGKSPNSQVTNINLGPDETEFGKTLAKDAAANLGELQKGARSASSSYGNIERLTPLLNSPAFISGTLGNTRLAIAKAFGLEGAEETQTFFSQMGRETAEAIRSFGSGTGLSDNDRVYAEKIAGGNVELTPGAIKRILFLRQQANRAAIIQYNDERAAASVSNPKSNVDRYYRDIPAPPPPSYNYKGWRLETDAQGNMAYVSPDRKSFQETR